MLKKVLIGLLIIALLPFVAYFGLNLVMDLYVHYKKPVIVPELKGKTIEMALIEVAPMGMSIIKEGDEYNNRVAPDTILRQTPPAGMTVKEGRIIRVTLSRGVETVIVPELIGENMRAASIALSGLSLTMGEVSWEVVDEGQERGVVLSQRPVAGTEVNKGSTVSILVSK